MALFRLAEVTGHADPDRMGATIPASVLSEWVRYWTVKAELERQAVENAKHK